MIPAYNPPAEWFKQALDSVLQQSLSPAEMQIEVVDDCSPTVSVQEWVRRIAGDRIGYSRTPKNLGLAGCWNYCIERARGTWVHLLHQDDYILPGFYAALGRAAEAHPSVNLMATRAHLVDSAGVSKTTTPRIPDLETGGTAVEDFFYTTPIQCPAIVVRRSFYEAHGGFRNDLTFSLDCEMWTRVISKGGGVVLPEILAAYRMTDVNQSSRLSRTAEGLRDLQRLHRIFSERHQRFDPKKGAREICEIAWKRFQFYNSRGDIEAANANFEFWNLFAPASMRLRKSARSLPARLKRLVR